MRTHLSRLRGALVLLLVGSACLFFVGSTIERHHRHHETATAKPAAVSGGETGSESGSTTAAEGAKPAEQHTETASGEAGAKILGIKTESLALSIVAVVASVLLAIGVWIGVWPRLVLLAVTDRSVRMEGRRAHPQPLHQFGAPIPMKPHPAAATSRRLLAANGQAAFELLSRP